MLMKKEREQVVETGKKMSSSGLCLGTSGNASVYDPETGYMVLSPSGMDYFSIEPEDVVVMDLDGHIVDGARKPSSEWALHSEFYKHKPAARGVVHTHSIYCTTFAVLGMPLKAVHYVIADAGVCEVPCAEYQTFGTVELAQAAMKVCGDSNAVLLGNHGIITCGASIAAAFSLAQTCEYVAQLQYQALCVGTPNVLSQEAMEVVMEKFKTYGQPGGKKGY